MKMIKGKLMESIFVEKKYKEKIQLFEKLGLLNKKRSGVRDVVKIHSKWVDETAREYLSSIDYSKKNFSIVALGGYGRKQLNLHSDIDIMLLVKNTIDDSIIKGLYDFFYNLGYECSISTRTIEECIELSKKDDTIKTSLYDSRFLYGSFSIFKEFENVLINNIIKNNTQEFIESKLEYMKSRYEIYGNTIFVLEPNIKEGVGALRDYHTLLWIGKTIFLTKNVLEMKKRDIISNEDYIHLKHSLYFLWQLRNALHFVTGKKTDILHLDLRKKVAKEMGYANHDRFDAQERLMRKYYYNARYMERLTQKYLNIFLQQKQTENKKFYIENNIFFSGNVLFNKKKELNIEDIFYIFFYSALYDFNISVETLDKMKKTINYSIRKNRKNEILSFVFRSILSMNKPIAKTIRMMHETGLLDKYIPEFGNICCLTEYSLYHKYTVDEHSIQALEHLDLLYDFDVPKTFLVRLSYLWKNLKPHEKFVLRLAVLLHDIGKIEKKNHEIIGAKLSKIIAKRLNIGKHLEEKLAFLIENHLLINRTVSGRDIEDSKTLRDFIDVVKSKENLILLNLLNYADMKAVNDNVWTSWRESIIESLYIQATYYFEDKNYDEFLKINARESKRIIKALLGNDYSNAIEEFPDNIFRDIDTKNAAQYIKDIQNTNRNVFIYKTGKEIDKLLVYYKNEFGLFHKISGVLACFNINIISAKSYNLKNDLMIIDIFNVKIPKNDNIKAEYIENMLMDVEHNKINLSECIAAKKNVFLSRSEKAKIEISLSAIDVKIDNDLSDIYTVISIKAPDRVGLVYDITKIFLKFNMHIGMFILDTKGAFAVDTFYIADEHFKKIYSNKLIDVVKSGLYEILSR